MGGVASTARLGALYLGSKARRALGDRRADSARIILMYHRVIDPSAVDVLPEPGTWVDRETFERQIRFLKDACRFVSLSELVAGLEYPATAGERVCALTFDDGWRDSLTNALPVIKRYGVPATVFLATRCVEEGKPPWPALAWDRLLSLTDGPTPKQGSCRWPAEFEGMLWRLAFCENGWRKRDIAARCIAMMKGFSMNLRRQTLDYLLGAGVPPQEERLMLSWDEVRTMRDAGVEFGAHSRSHAILTHLDSRGIEEEVRRSRAEIEEVLGEPVKAFAYPNGDFDERVRRAVVLSGYRSACGTRQSQCLASDDIFALPRIGVHQGISEWLAPFSARAFALRLGIAWG